jgi:lipoxygenase homology domain-containing protein 1
LNLNLDSATGCYGSSGPIIINPRRRVSSNHYDSINDPHLRDFFERKFQLSSGIAGKTKKLKLKRKPLPGECVYRIKVKTGNALNAGTDAKVFITIAGKRGTLPKKLLFNKYEAIRLEGGNYKFKFEKNSKNIFKIIAPDIGHLSHIIIEHDGKNVNSGWLLDSITITNMKTNRTWLFECNEWLSRHQGFCQTFVQLMPTRQIEKYLKTDYEIVTITGNGGGSGGDKQQRHQLTSNVFITLFGANNTKTSKLELKTDKNDKLLFAPNETNIFRLLNVNNVGIIHKLRIEHDNYGKHPDWYLERIVITDLKDPKRKYYCFCSNWLSDQLGDCQISRDLTVTDDPFSVRKMNKYKISVFTGNKRNAGTDADVVIVLYGSLGESGEWKLDDEKNNFERGHKDEFCIECPSVGELKKIRIGHNNKGVGAGWFLSKVIIDDLEKHRVYEFNCERWLATDEDDGKTTVFLQVNSNGNKKTAKAGVPYIVSVYTGDIRNAGTSANVFIEMLNDKDEASGRIALIGGKFRRGECDKLTIEAPDMISPLNRCVISHDNSGVGPGWFLSHIEIECPVIGMKQVFPCERWLAQDEEDGKIERILKENKSLRTIRKPQQVWYLWVYTSDLKYAGTNSNVSICIYGDKGKTDDVQLKNKSDTFEAGRCDEFKIETEDVGIPFKMRVWHDNKGSFTFFIFSFFFFWIL